MATKISGTNTAASPAITGDDTDTGLSFGTDTVNISTGGTTKATVDSAGRLLLGTTTEGHTSGDDLTIATTGGATGITLRSDTDEGGRIFFSDGTSGADEYRGVVGYSHGTNHMYFSTDASERMRLDSNGKVGIGTTTIGEKFTIGDGDLKFYNSNEGSNHRTTFIEFGNSSNRITSEANFGSSSSSNYTAGYKFTTKNWTGSAFETVTPLVMKANGYVGIGNTDPARHLEVLDWSSSGSSAGLEIGIVGIRSSKTGSSTTPHLRFYNSNGQVGSVETASSSTNYNTSSDYRLKENVASISDGITRIKQLKPSKFNWISDETNTPIDGFLAHEVSSIVPEAITGTKDAVAIQKDVDDVIAEKVGDPIYQTIDQSKLVPLLTAALKEAIAKIETLETKVAALEAA